MLFTQQQLQPYSYTHPQPSKKNLPGDEPSAFTTPKHAAEQAALFLTRSVKRSAMSPRVHLGRAHTRLTHLARRQVVTIRRCRRLAERVEDRAPHVACGLAGCSNLSGGRGSRGGGRSWCGLCGRGGGGTRGTSGAITFKKVLDTGGVCEVVVFHFCGRGLGGCWG